MIKSWPGGECPSKLKRRQQSGSLVWPLQVRYGQSSIVIFRHSPVLTSPPPTPTWERMAADMWAATNPLSVANLWLVMQRWWLSVTGGERLPTLSAISSILGWARRYWAGVTFFWCEEFRFWRTEMRRSWRWRRLCIPRPWMAPAVSFVEKIESRVISGTPPKQELPLLPENRPFFPSFFFFTGQVRHQMTLSEIDVCREWGPSSPSHKRTIPRLAGGDDETRSVVWGNDGWGSTVRSFQPCRPLAWVSQHPDRHGIAYQSVGTSRYLCKCTPTARGRYNSCPAC